MIFTDEKDFMIGVARNRQNDVVYGHKKKEIPVDRLYHKTSRFSKMVMVSAGSYLIQPLGVQFVN